MRASQRHPPPTTLWPAGGVQDERQYMPLRGTGEGPDAHSTQFPLEVGASQAATQAPAAARGPTSFASVVALAKQHTSGKGDALLGAL